jgi:hypothetical protein
LLKNAPGLIDRPGSALFCFDRGIWVRGGESDNQSLSPRHEAALEQGFRPDLAGHDVLDEDTRMLPVGSFRVEGPAQFPIRCQCDSSIVQQLIAPPVGASNMCQELLPLAKSCSRQNS